MLSQVGARTGEERGAHEVWWENLAKRDQGSKGHSKRGLGQEETARLREIETARKRQRDTRQSGQRAG